MDFVGEPRQDRSLRCRNAGRLMTEAAEDILALIPLTEANPRIDLAAGLEVFTNPFDAEDEHSGGKIREHGLAEVFRGAGAMLFGLRLYLQFVLLLLELLDDRVVEIQRQSVERTG